LTLTWADSFNAKSISIAAIMIDVLCFFIATYLKKPNISYKLSKSK
jgi:hypothetical protein